MQHSIPCYPAMRDDVMQIWAQRALQQRAAFDALADYMRKR